MAKMQNPGLTIKISIDQIIESENIRKEYTNIDELAESIKTKGQLQPVIVRGTTETKNGLPMFELICGYRRYRAIKSLREKGEDISLIEAKIITGDKDILQLIENIQRENISQKEQEAGIKKMLESGLQPLDIARELNKRITWVSDLIAGIKVRETAESAGIDTNNISTKALSQLRSVPKEKQTEAVKEAIDKGGRVSDATIIKDKFKNTGKIKKQKGDTAEIENPAKKDNSAALNTDTTGTIYVSAKRIETIINNFITEKTSLKNSIGIKTKYDARTFIELDSAIAAANYLKKAIFDNG